MCVCIDIYIWVDIDIPAEPCCKSLVSLVEGVSPAAESGCQASQNTHGSDGGTT